MTTELAASAAPTQEISEAVSRLRATFASGRTRSIHWREQQLRGMVRLVLDNEAAIGEAVASDLGRDPFESWLAEIIRIVRDAEHAARNVRRWTRRRHRLLELAQMPGRAWIQYEPYGTVLIIGPWNVPFALTLGPAVGAIAAGNTVILKPSEGAPGVLCADGVPGAAIPRTRMSRSRPSGSPGSNSSTPARRASRLTTSWSTRRSETTSSLRSARPSRRSSRTLQRATG